MYFTRLFRVTCDNETKEVTWCGESYVREHIRGEYHCRPNRNTDRNCYPYNRSYYVHLRLFELRHK